MERFQLVGFIAYLDSPLRFLGIGISAFQPVWRSRLLIFVLGEVIPANRHQILSRRGAVLALEGLQGELSQDRDRHARIILGEAETQISNKFAEAANVYRDNPVALHLRAMNMLYEAIKEKGSMVIVPSSAVETMGLGGTLATAAIGGAKPVRT